MGMIASIIIPAKDRPVQLNRAVQSVLLQPGSDRVEIIIVDDNSSRPLQCALLRPHDLIIRNTVTRGAAISRNIGIRASSGQLIYLLDSDDRFLARNFESDYVQYSQSPLLHYVDIFCSGARYCYPSSLTRELFFSAVFKSHPHICQTSSLMFTRCNLRFFDESLPKHQDWDLVLTYLSSYSHAQKIEGLSEFDRSDRFSLSRTFAPDRSSPWMEKLQRSADLRCTDDELRYASFMTQGGSTRHYPWATWLSSSASYLARREANPLTIAKAAYRRVRFIGAANKDVVQ
ncbi:Glycosyltransferase involved in cell wall bisynthesis [Halopseudomonas xinjiangensis]|uniref:Glycosyltransferase involved in cell wall bisynthesis n=1 Tax=Halopseudomonas xinjiangensis TaxID=487184 RepID=A0A1H1NKE0_9GAMM|nr:glycosyltransferase family 2 protein [Halopseudomonas xinjiangensis]SDR99511.1 Glycosyltransferase involved in cell wall bisynthesis [Halopseudomonas xinjiangensis]